MKKSVLYCAVVLILSSCCAQRLPKNQAEPKLGEVVEAVQKEYLAALQRLKNDKITGISITKADIALKITQKNSANSDITVWIFKPSDKYIQTRTSTVTYELSTATGGTGGANAHAKNHDLQDMIYYTIKNFDGLNNTIGGLTKNNVVLDIDFSIENDASVGLTFKILGFGTDIGGEMDHTVDQDLKLTFMPTALIGQPAPANGQPSVPAQPPLPTTKNN
jgi:hypothetical protein